MTYGETNIDIEATIHGRLSMDASRWLFVLLLYSITDPSVAIVASISFNKIC